MRVEARLHPKDIPLYQRTVFNMTHQPVDVEQLNRIEEVRNAAKRMAGIIYMNSHGRSRERSSALTNLEQAVMWAVASIAREGWDDAPTS